MKSIEIEFFYKFPCFILLRFYDIFSGFFPDVAEERRKDMQILIRASSYSCLQRNHLVYAQSAPE